MRVIRGRGQTPESDGEQTTQLIEETAATGERALRVWTPHRQIAFGRRDSNREGYDRARQIARERDFAVIDRTVGGHAVAFTGNTIAFAMTEPVEDARTGIDDRYDRTAATLTETLDQLGVTVREGEPDRSFCPGTHSLSATGKIVGLAQRVHREVAVVSGIVIVCDHEEVAGILTPVYETLDIPFDPETVGSIHRAGGPGEPSTVARRLETALTGGRPVSIEQVRET